MWCDVGCGVGELLICLKQNYSGQFKGIGIESDPAEIRFGQDKGLEIVQGFITPEITANEIIEIIHKADIVSMLNVLEHIEKPDEMIAFFKQHMKSGAYLAIEVPRHPSLASFVNLMSPELTYRHIEAPAHLQVFSDKSIEKMAGEEFQLVASWGFGQGYTDILTSAMLLGNITEMGLYEALMDISNDVQKVIDGKGFSDQMIYILERR
jgi:2-polyprenyl-3-methyl-5-hydroxy-6-metoxy-1,4-benzoquinol methylase